ncbi:class I SAM-dependent methyltransferase [Candidatus Dependentiae bacterium]
MSSLFFNKSYKWFFLVVFFAKNLFAGDMEAIFTTIYKKHLWGGGNETVSGSGSLLKNTNNIRECIPHIIKRYNITSILDIPCGDFNWMKAVDLEGVQYIGADIVLDLINKNQSLYGDSNKIFFHLDATKDPLPKADMILCRDLFLHIPIKEVMNCVVNFKKSGAKYLLVNTYLDETKNKDKETSGSWRHLNLQIEPFNFPEPIEAIKEGVHSNYKKCLALWCLDDIDIDKERDDKI